MPETDPIQKAKADFEQHFGVILKAQEAALQDFDKDPDCEVQAGRLRAAMVATKSAMQATVQAFTGNF